MRRSPRIPGEAVRIGASTFAGGGVTLQYYLPWVIIGNYDSVGHVFTLVPKVIGVNDLPNLQVNLAPGETESYPVFPFQSVSIDTSTANAIYFYSDQAISSTATVQTSTLSNGGKLLPQHSSPITCSASTFTVKAAPPTNTLWRISGLQGILILDPASTATVTEIQIGELVAGGGSLVFSEDWTVGSLADNLTAGQSDALNIGMTSATGAHSGGTIDHFLAGFVFPLEVLYTTQIAVSFTLSAGTGTGTIYLTGFGYQLPC